MNLIEAIALASARARGIRKMTSSANIYLATVTQHILLSEQMLGCAGSNDYTVNTESINPESIIRHHGREVARLSVAYRCGYTYAVSYPYTRENAETNYSIA